MFKRSNEAPQGSYVASQREMILIKVERRDGHTQLENTQKLLAKLTQPYATRSEHTVYGTP